MISSNRRGIWRYSLTVEGEGEFKKASNMGMPQSRRNGNAEFVNYGNTRRLEQIDSAIEE